MEGFLSETFAEEIERVANASAFTIFSKEKKYGNKTGSKDHSLIPTATVARNKDNN